MSFPRKQKRKMVHSNEKPKKKAKREDTRVRAYAFSMRFSIPKTEGIAEAAGYRKWLEIFFEDHHLDKYIMQLEDSKKDEVVCTPDPWEHNLHYQIACKSSRKKLDVAVLKRHANEGPLKGLDIRIASNAGRIALEDYCMKKDASFVEGPWFDKSRYRGEDLVQPGQWVSWQTRLDKFIHEVTPGKRKILWYYDPTGGSGKSAFAKYQSFTNGYLTCTFSKAGDMLYLVAARQNKRCYLFNLSKTKPADISHQELYAALEAIKDGHFISMKFTPVSVLMRPCHVIVFSNSLPDCSAMTQCRIQVIKVPPLPAHLLEENFEFDFGDCEVMTEQSIQLEKANIEGIPMENVPEASAAFNFFGMKKAIPE